MKRLGMFIARLLASMLALVIAMSAVSATASQIDLGALSQEELLALQEQINQSLQANTDADTHMASLVILNAMKEKGAPIGDLLDYNADTDPNGPGKMGTPGFYTSKTNFGCAGYAPNANGLVGGTLECFQDTTSAQARYTYLQTLEVQMPSISADRRIYLREYTVLRIDTVVSGNLAKEIVGVFESVVPSENPTVIFDPTISVLPSPVPGPQVKGAPADIVSPEYTELKKGTKGGEAAKLQARLKELGFLTGLADGNFGGQTEKAMKDFQVANGQPVTGVASIEDQKIMFATGAICADGTPAEEYDPYAVCPIELSKVDLKTSYGSPYVSFSAKNISSVPIKAFTYEVECYDAYEDRLTDYDKASFVSTYSKTIGVGKSVSVSTRDEYGIYGFTGVAIIKVAIIRALLEDGTDIVYDDPVWFEGN